MDWSKASLGFVTIDQWERLSFLLTKDGVTRRLKRVDTHFIQTGFNEGEAR